MTTTVLVPAALKRARARRGLSLRDAGHLVGVTYGCFANWENGLRVSAKAEPRLREVFPDAFGVDEVANLRRVLVNCVAILSLVDDNGDLGSTAVVMLDEAREVLRG